MTTHITQTDDLDLSGHARTVLLIKYTAIFIGIAAGGWTIYFILKGNLLNTLIEAVTTVMAVVIYLTLRAGLTNIAAHMTFITMYLFILVAVHMLEGIGNFPYTVNHLFIIPSIPAVFMFFYSSPAITRYTYTGILIITFIIIEYNLFNLSLPSTTDIETKIHARPFALLFSTFVITYLFYLFSRQVYKTEEALVDVNNKLETIVEKLLPKRIAEKLRNSDEEVQDTYSECTILVADIVGFTPLTMTLSPEEILNLLNGVFFKFDQICEKHGLEKIKTIGDAYILAGGIPDPMPNHADAVAEAALEFLDIFGDDDAIDIRIGIHSGEVHGGIIGKKRFIYDLWGKAVTISSTMEREGVSGKVHVSHDTYLLIRDKFNLSRYGEVKTEWGETIKTYLLDSQKETMRKVS